MKRNYRNLRFTFHVYSAMNQNNHPLEVASGQTLVYLVRHGLTGWNVEKRFQGQLDVPLNQEGLDQSHSLCAWLSRQPVRFSAIYSSDLTRAMQTAQVVGECLHLVPQPATALREIHCGEWQGLSVEEVEASYPGQLTKWHENVDSYSLPGGESIPEVQERIFAFYKNVIYRHMGEAIILVSHGAALSALQAAIHEWDLVETWRTRSTRMGNTGVTALSLDVHSGKASVILHNSTEHLARPTGMASLLDPSA